MSKIYNAGQYDQAFSSKRLQMYEIPKADLAEPHQRTTEITFVANEKGHLLPGVSRGESNPFGDYVGTWDLPKSIPGPYHLVKTGRSKDNVEKLREKRVKLIMTYNWPRQIKNHCLYSIRAIPIKLISY